MIARLLSPEEFLQMLPPKTSKVMGEAIKQGKILIGGPNPKPKKAKRRGKAR